MQFSQFIVLHFQILLACRQKGKESASSHWKLQWTHVGQDSHQLYAYIFVMIRVDHTRPDQPCESDVQIASSFPACSIDSRPRHDSGSQARANRPACSARGAVSWICVDTIQDVLPHGHQRPQIAVRDRDDAHILSDLGANVPRGSDALTLVEMMSFQTSVAGDQITGCLEAPWEVHGGAWGHPMGLFLHRRNPCWGACRQQDRESR